MITVDIQEQTVYCTCERPVLPGTDHCGDETCRRYAIDLDVAHDRAGDR